MARDKPLHWVGSSKRDFLAFPSSVQRDFGYALGVAQLGGRHPHAKPWKGEGVGIFEIVERFDGNTFRTAYTVRFERAVYVLHAFQKKSPSGIRTSAIDVDVIRRRLRTAREDYEYSQTKHDEREQSHDG